MPLITPRGSVNHSPATSGGGGPYSLDKGQSFTLDYRVILHRGDEKSANIADAFAAYAKEKLASGK